MGIIRELIWPRLEGEPPTYDNFLPENTDISDGNIDVSVEMAKLMFEKQRERVSTVESKSSIFLGFFGTVVAILAFALKDILFSPNKGLTHDIALLVGAILVIYILQVMRYSIQALERRGYQSLDETDFLHGDKKKTAISLINKVKGNYDAINLKVDSMTMAYEFTKRIVWILYLAALALIVLSLHNYFLPLLNLIMDIFSLLIDLRWSDYLLGALTLTIFYIVIRIRKIEKKLKND